MKNLFLFLFLIVTASFSFAGEIGFSRKLTGTAITSGATLFVEDDRYAYMTTTGTWTNEFWNQAVKNRFSLRFVDTAVAQNYKAGNWGVTVNATVERWNTSGASVGTYTISLVLDVKPGQTAYSQDLNVYQDASTSGHKTKITVNSVTFSGTASSVPIDVMLESEIVVERYYKFDQSTVPTINHSVNATLNTITFYWDIKNWAEEYELEWLWAGIDDPNEQVTLNWDRAVRINTGRNYYIIQNTFDEGKVYYRLRWVAKDQATLRRVESGWSSVTPSTDGVLIYAAPSSNLVVFESDKHWSYSASFAEEGKRSESVSFVDALGRSRQQMGLVNSENMLLVSEPFFDYEGRPVLQTLATPTPDFSGTFGYRSNYTRALGSSTLLEPKDYDTDLDYTNCVSGFDVELDTAYGASKYFSPHNILRGYGMNAFLPNAQKYPYMHLRFNLEGDVAAVSGPGLDHALGSGHESKVWYSSVPQDKLWELFGSSVGYASHYRAQYVQDANGQISGSYEDMSGKVIATFLAGSKPTNVDALASYTALPNPLPITNYNFLELGSYDPSVPAYKATYDLSVTSNEPLTINYGVTATTYEDICRNTHDCKYNVKIEIYSANCETPVYTHSDAVIPPSYSHTASIGPLAPGQYKVIKTLSLDQVQFAAAVSFFEAHYCSTFVAPALPVLDCDPQCETGDCDPASSANQSDCEDLKDALKHDMSPGGQYFENSAMFANLLSTNNLTYTQINSFSTGQTVNGITSSCNGTGGISDYSTLKANWNDCIAELLVTLHPEYCHLGWCVYEDEECNGVSSREFDLQMMSITSYTAANAQYSFVANDEGQSVLDDDPYFGVGPTPTCATSTYTLYSAMLNVVDPAGNANDMWNDAATLAGSTGTDDHWNVFKGLYQTEKANRVKAAKIAAGCNYLPDMSGGNSSTVNGMHETASYGSFNIHVIDPGMMPAPTSTATPSPYETNPNLCGGSYCGVLSVGDCNMTDDRFDVASTFSVTAAWTDVNNNAHSMTIAQCGTCVSSLSPSAFVQFVAAQINAFVPNPPVTPGVYPAWSASYTGNTLTICALPPNHIKSGSTVTITISGVTENCSVINSPPIVKTFTYTAAQNNDCLTPSHCFCSELANLHALYQSGLANTSGYTEWQFMAAYLNDLHGSTATANDVQMWYGNCSTSSNPTFSPALPSQLNCQLPPWDCVDEAYAPIYQNALDAYNNKKAQDIADFKAAYIAACFNPANLAESFTGQIRSGEYHYTLYYYDQADNLVRTVSPKAVQKMSLTTQMKTDLTNYLSNPSTYSPVYPTHVYTYAAGSGHSVNIDLVTKLRYNSLNQPVETKHADEDASTKYYYDWLGRLVASQNAKQAVLGTYSYTLFDYLGRVWEAGEVVSPTSPNSSNLASVSAFSAWVTGTSNTRNDVTQVFYNETVPVTYTVNGFNQNPDHMRMQVSSVTYEKNYTSAINTYDAASYYQYDVHGFTERVLKDVSELSVLSQNLKQTRYEFEYISGNVIKVAYQEGQPDQFIHTYDYDADNRLIREYTSHQGIIYHNDEKQFYYLHGPVARTEIGQHKVQGQDFIYTIQGWLKGINGSVLNQHKEAGKDGRMENMCISTYSTTPQYSYGNSNQNIHSRIASDAFGFVLNYYDENTSGGHLSNEDYKPVNTNSYSILADINSHNSTSKNLYNGNITQMSVALMKGNSGMGVDVTNNNLPFAGQAISLLTWQYKYDQLHRLTEANAFTGTSTSSYAALSNTNEYKNTFVYDANGNIEHQLRNGNTAKLNLDDLSYNYKANSTGGATNRLLNVTEGHATSNNINYGDDFDKPVAPYNPSIDCDYDEIGNLKKDDRHHVINITWNVMGKVVSVEKDRSWKYDDKNYNGVQDGGELSIVLSDIEYRYNEMGQRIVKIVKPHHASLPKLKNQDEWIYTYYSYDGGGNLMAVYERDFTTPSGEVLRYNDILKLDEHHIYAGSRVGMATYSNKEVAKITYNYSNTIMYILQGTNPQPASYSLNTTNENRTLGTRLYELINHLGNVLVTVSDKKIPVFEDVGVCGGQYNVLYEDVFTHYTADVQSTTDYSPFGAPLEGRSFAINNYRYGMNGQEKDNEIYGDGNAMSAEYWMYDARLGRRWNVDPIYKPWESPYATFSNNPVYFADPHGLDAEAGNEGESKSDPGNGGGGIEKGDGDEFSDPNDGCEPDPEPVTPPIVPGSGSPNESSVPSVEVVTEDNANFAWEWPCIEKGQKAHLLFTAYWQRMDPTKRYWTADKAINAASGYCDRPDLVYDNGSVGGVWELKPEPPAPSAANAHGEALGYALQLNAFNNDDRFGTGSSTGAPIPIIGNLYLKDGNRIFKYYLPDSYSGAIYYSEITKEKVPEPVPVVVTKKEPATKPVLQPPVLQPVYDYGFQNEDFSGAFTPGTQAKVVGAVIIIITAGEAGPLVVPAIEEGLPLLAPF